MAIRFISQCNRLKDSAALKLERFIFGKSESVWIYQAYLIFLDHGIIPFAFWYGPADPEEPQAE
jgi:hypothetical protein